VKIVEASLPVVLDAGDDIEIESATPARPTPPAP
jgi:hypothetical protein